MAFDDPYQWMLRVPPTVTTYKQCFESMVDNKAFEEFILSGDDAGIAQDWDDFDTS